MYLRELTLRAAPGLPADVKISELRPGLVLLYGANASGKSTIGRTIGGILGLSNPPTNVDATSTWQLDDQAESTAKGTVVYGTRHWEPQDRWAGPPSDVASFWSLTLRGLLQTSDSSDAGIALEIQRQLSGGFDLHAAKSHFDYRHQPHRSRKTEAKQARSALRDHLRDQQDLAAQERDLEDLRQRCDEAATAPSKLDAVNRAISLHEKSASLQALEA